MYPIAQIIELATGKPPTAAQLDGWTAYENTGGSLQSIVEAFVASTMFANKYNNGTSINPDAPISATVAQEIIENALGAMPATALVISPTPMICMGAARVTAATGSSGTMK